MKTLIKQLFRKIIKLFTQNHNYELYTPDPKKEPETELDYNPIIYKKTKKKKTKNDPHQRPLL